jgi:hypothetical protein
MTAATLVFTVAFALTFYVLGATVVEGFVNYRTWALIGAREFTPYHRAVGSRVIVFVVIPIGFAFVFTACLLRWRPPSIPPWSVWVSLVLNAVAIGISFAFQIPIQRQLDRTGLSMALLKRLISIEWLRNSTHVANSVVFLWMMVRVLGRDNGP